MMYLQEIRKKTQMIAQKNTIPHRLSRGGFDLLERRIVEEKLKRQQAESGSAELIYPPSLLSRHEKWKLARTKLGGQMTSEKSLEISLYIVSS